MAKTHAIPGTEDVVTDTVHAGGGIMVEIVEKKPTGKKKGGKKKPAAKDIPVPPANLKPAKPTNLSALPDGIHITVDVDALIFDRDLQMRCAPYDEFTVSEYANIYKDAKDDPESPFHKDPSKALPELRVIDTGENLYVYDGFQRGGGLKEAGIKQCRVISTKGTKKDAEFFALRANATHGLKRDRNDCRRAVNTVLDDHELFDRVRASAEKYGGLNRAMAVACGVSKGLVANILRERGLTFTKKAGVYGVAKLPAPKQPAAAKPGVKDDAATSPNLFTPATPDHTDPAQNPDHGLTPEQQSAKIKATASRILFHELKKAAANLQRIGETLAERDDAGEILRAEMNGKGKESTPFVVMKGEPKDDHMKRDKQPDRLTWPVLQSIIERIENAERRYLETVKEAAK